MGRWSKEKKAQMEKEKAKKLATNRRLWRRQQREGIEYHYVPIPVKSSTHSEGNRPFIPI